jgi:hypothetical protein
VFQGLPYVSYATSPLLAIISGFLLFRHLEGLPHLGAKVQQRLTTLAVPYLIWTFIYFAAFQSMKAVLAHTGLSGGGFLHNPTANWSLREYWAHYVISPNPSAFWYVQNLMLILPCSFLLYPILKIRRTLVPCLILIVVGYTLKVPLYFHDRFLPYFVIGAWFGLHHPEGPGHLNWKPGTLWGLTLFLTALSRLLEFNDEALATVARVPVYCAICFLFFSAVRASWNSRWIVQLNRKAGVSFLMHASHQLILVLLAGLFALGLHLTHHGMPSGWAVDVAAGAFLFVSCVWLIDRLDMTLRRFAPRLHALLNGTRHQSATGTPAPTFPQEQAQDSPAHGSPSPAHLL